MTATASTCTSFLVPWASGARRAGAKRFSAWCPRPATAFPLSQVSKDLCVFLMAGLGLSQTGTVVGAPGLLPVERSAMVDSMSYWSKVSRDIHSWCVLIGQGLTGYGEFPFPFNDFTKLDLGMLMWKVRAQRLGLILFVVLHLSLCVKL